MNVNKRSVFESLLLRFRDARRLAAGEPDLLRRLEDAYQDACEAAEIERRLLGSLNDRQAQQ